jgi:hypothetical protein
MLPTRLLLPVVVALLAGAPAAQAASVAYTDANGNLVVASPDGGSKLTLTSDGTPAEPYYAAAQSVNGVTVAAHREQLDKLRSVLHKFSPVDGSHEAANVLPASALASSVVSPLGMDIDAAGETVAFGYSTCGLTEGCINRTYGYWLTFASHGPAKPSYPQGSTGLYSPSFYGNRIVSTDSYKVMVQEPLNAPFNDGHAGWIDPGSARFWAAEVAAGARQIALQYQDSSGHFGLVIASGDGVLGGATELKCFMPVVGDAGEASWSPDGVQLAWQDDEGVKVGTPDIGVAPGEGDVCAMKSGPKVIAADGKDPNFGGADVAAMKAARGSAPGPAPSPGPAPAPGQPVSISLRAPATMKRSVRVAVTVPGAGSVRATLARGRKIVGSGRTAAAGAGTVKVRVKLRRGVRPRRFVLRVEWRGADGRVASASAKVKAR